MVVLDGGMYKVQCIDECTYVHTVRAGMLMRLSWCNLQLEALPSVCRISVNTTIYVLTSATHTSQIYLAPPRLPYRPIPIILHICWEDKTITRNQPSRCLPGILNSKCRQNTYSTGGWNHAYPYWYFLAVSRKKVGVRWNWGEHLSSWVQYVYDYVWLYMTMCYACGSGIHPVQSATRLILKTQSVQIEFGRSRIEVCRATRCARRPKAHAHHYITAQ